MSHSSVTASVNLQSLGKDNNTVINTKQFKQARVESVREDDGQVMYVRISQISNGNKVIGQYGYPLVDMQIFERFVIEGKATIKLPKSSVQIMINNCPPGDLKLFISTLKFKSKISVNTVQDLKKNKALDKIIPRAISSLDTISPIRKSDKFKLQNKALENHFPNINPITPEKKRPLQDINEDFNTPPNKKLKVKQYTSTPNAKTSIQEIDKMFEACEKLKKSASDLDVSLNDSGITEYYQLNNEQKKIIECVRSGENVFYTGSAGTGKTFLLKKIIGTLVPQYTAITASTGIAASLIDGVTLHNFAGIGAKITSFTASASIIMRKPQLLMQWRKCKHLIIDEISLISAEYFDHLDQIARVVRNNTKVPFGGIQLIISGDFFQLPPILPREADKKYKFVFQSKVFEQAFKEIHFLTEVKRQSDQQFVAILSEIRMGKCSEATEKLLRATANQNIERNGIIPTQLCTHKDDVEQKNQSNLNSLPGEPEDFFAIDSISGHKNVVDSVSMVPSKLTLKVGAQVMLLKNIDLSGGLANGSRGVVVGFEPAIKNRYPLVRFASGKVYTMKPESFSVSISSGGQSLLIARSQIPLKLAYSISIHKSQGMTLDCVDLYLANTFECGQAYVALSRCKSLDSMRVMSWSNHCVKANYDVIKFFNKYQIDDILGLCEDF